MSIESEFAKTANAQPTKTKIIIVAILVIVIGLGGYFIWRHFHPAATVEQPPAPVYETYTESHSADGVQQAAEQLGIHLDLGQQKEIVQVIQGNDTQKPDSVVQTTGA